MTTYTYLEDAGHSWLQVPMADIEALGIKDSISQYSYRKGTIAYLEEDSDAPKFCQAFAEHWGYPPLYTSVFVGNYANIRNYHRFKGD